MVANKADIRQRLRAELLAFTTRDPASRTNQSNAVARHLAADPLFKNAMNVALFAALPYEIDTLPIHNACLALGKKAFYPLLKPQSQTLDFFEVSDPTDRLKMKVGGAGIAQPVVASGASPAAQLDLFVLPGLAFTADGHRLGSGAGYYDRTLAQAPFAGCARYGIAFDFQVLAELPVQAHDLRCHKVFTPGQVYMGLPTGDTIEREEQ